MFQNFEPTPTTAPTESRPSLTPTTSFESVLTTSSSQTTWLTTPSSQTTSSTTSAWPFVESQQDNSSVGSTLSDIVSHVRQVLSPEIPQDDVDPEVDVQEDAGRRQLLIGLICVAVILLLVLVAVGYFFYRVF